MSDYNNMPANAIATGAVDYILDPELMPDVIEYYVKNDGTLLPHPFESYQEGKIILAIIDLIKDSLQLDFFDNKQTIIMRRIKNRAASLDFPGLEKYLAFLKSNRKEVEALAKDFPIGVTSFFRDRHAFRYLEKYIVPKIIKLHRIVEDIKVWVAGCATGEEAYSLAIPLKEELRGNYENLAVKIFATDIDITALAFAAKGVYTEMITKYVTAERTEKYFLNEENKYRVKPEIRKMLIFARHGLVKSPSYSNMDLISCPQPPYLYDTSFAEKSSLYAAFQAFRKRLPVFRLERKCHWCCGP